MNSQFVQRVVYALLRIVVTFVYMQHGWQKLFGAFGGFGPHGGPAPLHSLFGMAGEMAAAYFIAHAPRGFWTILNHGETPVLLCFAFLFFAVFGGGYYSLDTLRRGTRAGGLGG